MTHLTTLNVIDGVKRVHCWTSSTTKFSFYCCLQVFGNSLVWRKVCTEKANIHRSVLLAFSVEQHLIRIELVSFSIRKQQGLLNKSNQFVNVEERANLSWIKLSQKNGERDSLTSSYFIRNSGNYSRYVMLHLLDSGNELILITDARQVSSTVLVLSLKIFLLIALHISTQSDEERVGYRDGQYVLCIVASLLLTDVLYRRYMDSTTLYIILGKTVYRGYHPADGAGTLELVIQWKRINSQF